MPYSSNESESGQSDVCISLNFKNKKVKVSRQISSSEDGSDCAEFQILNTECHVSGKDITALRETNDESDCMGFQKLNTEPHLRSEDVVRKVDLGENITTCNKVQAWLSNQPFSPCGGTDEEKFDSKKEVCKEAESLVLSAEDATSNASLKENQLEDVEKTEAFDTGKCPAYTVKKSGSLPFFHLPTPNFDSFLIEAENLVHVDINLHVGAKLTYGADASPSEEVKASFGKSHIHSPSNISFPPFKDDIIVLNEGYEDIKESPLDKFKSKFFNQAKKNSSAVSIKTREGLNVVASPLTHSASPFRKADMPVINREELKEKLIHEIVKKKEAAFNKSKEMEKLENESLFSDSGVSENEENDILPPLFNDVESNVDDTQTSNEEECEPLSKVGGVEVENIQGRGSNHSEIAKAISRENSYITEEKLESDMSEKGEFENGFYPYSCSSIPSYQIGGGFADHMDTQETHSHSAVSDESASNSKYSDIGSNLLPEVEKDSIFQESEKLDESDCDIVSDLNKRKICNIERKRNVFEPPFDTLSDSNSQTNGFHSQDLNDFCSGKFQENVEASPWSPGQNISDNDIKDNDDHSSVPASGRNSPSAESEILKGFFDHEAELSGDDESGDDIDEDCEGGEDLDYIALDSGPSDDVLREEIAPLHLKQMVADDEEQLNLVKEIFLDDGELHAGMGGRAKKFTWKTNDENEEFSKQFQPESGSEEDDHENSQFDCEDKAKWRQQQHSVDLDSEHVDASPSLKRPLNLDIIGMRQIFPGEKSKKKSTLKRPRGSFLSLSDDCGTNVLKKLKMSELDPSGSRTTKHYVFTNDEINGAPVKSEKQYFNAVHDTIAVARTSSENMSALDEIVDFL